MPEQASNSWTQSQHARLGIAALSTNNADGETRTRKA